jgi:hypothetical protein
MKPTQLREKNRINEELRPCPEFYSLKDRKWHNSPDENNPHLDSANPPQGTISGQKYRRIYYRLENKEWTTVDNVYVTIGTEFLAIISDDDEVTRLIRLDKVEEIKLFKDKE